MFPRDLETLAEAVLAAYRDADARLTLAESCTGGLIAGCLTAIAGSSEVLERGFVTYSNQAKTELLGVPEALLTAHGAVSEEVARAMAEGALVRSNADISAAVTGIAGPGGGSAEKPVGLVHMAAAGVGRETLHERHLFHGDRQAVRLRAVRAVLVLLRRRLARNAAYP